MSNNGSDPKKRKLEVVVAKKTPAFNEPVVQAWGDTRFPHRDTWERVAQLSVEYDRPILMDYWHDSISKNAHIGVHKLSDTRMLIKASNLFTSPIKRVIQSPKENPTELILMTENSIYIVDKSILLKSIPKIPDDGDDYDN